MNLHPLVCRVLNWTLDKLATVTNGDWEDAQDIFKDWK